MRTRRLLIVLLLAACAMAGRRMRAADCNPEGNVTFICGVMAPEDLVAIPGGEWVIASGYSGGPIHLISTRTHTVTPLFPGPTPLSRPDSRSYASCPGPLDPGEREKFSAHGINLRPGSNGVHTLYVVHHGFRESIEVFELDVKAKPPVLTWIGCVVAPETATLNAVAPLPDGGFVATNPYRRSDPNARNRALAGGESGEIWEWHASEGWKIVPGSEGPGPNGIEVSKDGRWIYVNFWPANKVWRLSRGQASVQKTEIEVPFHPDNIRWQPDGSLLSAGHYAPTNARATECLRVNCNDAAARIARIDPKTMKAQQVVDYPSNASFFGATAALQVGKEIWIGSVRGDRVARYPIR